VVSSVLGCAENRDLPLVNFPKEYLLGVSAPLIPTLLPEGEGNALNKYFSD
jgi:hypothetical protein